MVALSLLLKGLAGFALFYGVMTSCRSTDLAQRLTMREGCSGTFLIAIHADSRTIWSPEVPDSKPAIYRDPFKAGEDPRRRRGRKVGSRAKLAVRFFEDTYAAWEEQGESALARAAFHDPMGFVSMVARLMPQKIEVSTPTDGMSDERLAEMLDMAERMARLRSQGVATPLLAHELADENAVTLDAAKEGGGGPLGLGGARGVNTPHALPAAPGRIAETPHNKLDVEDSNTAAASSPIAETPQSLPYPVGRPHPKADHVVERENRAKLYGEDDIDPASLF